jgi:hypothetical protein
LERDGLGLISAVSTHLPGATKETAEPPVRIAGALVRIPNGRHPTTRPLRYNCRLLVSNIEDASRRVLSFLNSLVGAE